MASHYIVPAPGQQLAPVIRRVQVIAKSVGENFRLDKSMPTTRLVVGDKTLARWHQLNAERRKADAESKASLAQRRADAAAAAAAAVVPVVEDEGDPAPVEDVPEDEGDEVEESAEEPVEEAAPAAAKKAAKKAATRKRQTTRDK